VNPLEDLHDTILVLADTCDRLGIEHAFGGAIAQNFWGVVRATNDIDLLIALPRIRFQELADALAAAGFHALDDAGNESSVSAARMAAQEIDRHFFEVHRGLVKAEVFLPFLPLQNSILRRQVRLPFGPRSIPVTSAEDLVLLKLALHREKDLRDVRGILWNQKGKLDVRYLREWAARMLANEVQDELEQWIRRYGS
jgi:hypothetical protein